MPPTLVSHEARPDQAPAVKRLLASLARQAADWPVRIALTGMPHALRQMAGAGLTNAPFGASGWDVKPHMLARALRGGAARAVWIDADVILTAPPGPVLTAAPGTLIASTERAWGGTRDDGARAQAWGFDVGRAFPAALNSAVLAVDLSHLPLLDAWADALCDARYRAEQARPWDKRDPLMHGDQDALTALLSGPFHGVPLRLLARGTEIVHAIGPRGMTTAERLIALSRGGPVFVHGQGAKPYTADRGRHPRRAERMLDVSPYTIAGGWPAVTRTGRALRWATRDHPVAAGLPLAAWHDIRTLPSRLRSALHPAP